MSKHTILLGKKKYPVSLNLIALEEYQIRENLKLEEMEEYLLSIGNSLKLLHFMMEYGARRAGTAFTMTVEDLADLIGMNTVLFSNTIRMFFPEAEKGKKSKRSKA